MRKVTRWEAGGRGRTAKLDVKEGGAHDGGPVGVPATRGLRRGAWVEQVGVRMCDHMRTAREQRHAS